MAQYTPPQLPALPASNLLIDERPILLLPKLATAIGVNEAIALQQLRYLLTISKNVRDGRRWVFNTYEQWQADQFPFWSVPTVKRVMAELEKKGLVLAAHHYNKMPTDRTKWYTIDFDRLAALDAEIAANDHRTDSSAPTDQLDTMDGSLRSDGADQVDPLLPETTSETTTENGQDPLAPAHAGTEAPASAPDPGDIDRRVVELGRIALPADMPRIMAALRRGDPAPGAFSARLADETSKAKARRR